MPSIITWHLSEKDRLKISNRSGQAFLLIIFFRFQLDFVINGYCEPIRCVSTLFLIVNLIVGNTFRKAFLILLS